MINCHGFNFFLAAVALFNGWNAILWSKADWLNAVMKLVFLLLAVTALVYLGLSLGFIVQLSR